MRSNVLEVLPSIVKRSLTEFGSDLAIARRKRGLTVLAVAERMGVAKNTYLRAEKGDPKVGLGCCSCGFDLASRASAASCGGRSSAGVAELVRKTQQHGAIGPDSEPLGLCGPSK
jgi:DNA-binding XRE family transcriptional regulator